MWPPPFRDAFVWLQTLPGSLYLREESPYAFQTLLVIHVLSLCLFLGLVFMMDIRMMGIGHLQTRISDLQKRTFAWQAVGGGAMVLSGAILFYAQPVYYWGKGFFWIKMLVMPLALANILFFHFVTYRSVDRWDTAASPPLPVKMAGMLSIVLWTAVLCFGRLVAYDWWTIVEGL